MPRQVFIPQPNVDSAVVSLSITEPYLNTLKDEVLFFSLVRSSFKQRRKTLLNNLEGFIDKPKSEISLWLESLDINPQARAESLSIETFIKLANNLCLQESKN